jgi:hypothetical protein
MFRLFKPSGALNGMHHPSLQRWIRLVTCWGWLLAAAITHAQIATPAPTPVAVDPVLGPLVGYRVLAGDTLISVRDRLLLPDASWQTLQQLNKVRDPRRLVPGSELLLPQAWFKEQPASAEVLHAFGDATVTRANGAVEKVLGGMSLSARDILKTGAQSSITLRFADGARLLVRPNTEATLARLTQSITPQRAPVAQTEVNLQRGAVEAAVPPTSDAATLKQRRFDIRTPVANLGVRGTSFRAEASDGEQRTEVLTGRVAVAASSNNADVAAGFGSVASAQGVQVKPLLPAPDVSGVTALFDKLPLTVQVPAVAGAVAYVGQLSLADKPDGLVGEQLDSGTRLRFVQDLADGQYLLRLRAVDASDLEGKDATVTITLNAKPEAPFLQRPTPQAVSYDEEVSFAWTRQPAAQTYHLQIADDPQFKTLRVDRSDLTDVKTSIKLPVGEHYWRLAAIQAGGTPQDHGPFSDAQQLTRKAPPPAPPPAQSSVADGQLTMRWPVSSEPGARYSYQLARDAAFNQIEAQGDTATPAFTAKPAGGGRYHFRVRTLTPDGYAGPWGSAQTVDLPDNHWWWLLLPATLLLL